MPSAASESAPSVHTLAGLPAWLAFSLLTILLWGAWGITSKIAADGVDANTNQVFFTFGLLPLVLWIWCAMRFRPKTGNKRSWIGIGWAFLTGILGGTGNIAFFHALVVGGKVSIVAPATALFLWSLSYWQLPYCTSTSASSRNAVWYWLSWQSIY